MHSEIAKSLWAFSVDVYARPGVAPACLALQERHGLDVNVLLACCWLGRAGVRLDQRAVGHLLAAAAPWHEMAVRPLRAVRQRLRTPLGAVPDARREDFRTRVKALELEAERLEQAALQDAAPKVPNAECGAPSARDNIAVWGRVAGHGWQAWDADELASVLAGAFPEAAAGAPALARSLIAPASAPAGRRAPC